MNDSLIRKFCESRYRWAIVATATVLFALAAILPQADDYFTKRNSRISLTEELASARATAESLPKTEKQVGELQGRLGALEKRAVFEETLPQFRSKLVELVRTASECQIRKVDVGSPTSRPWRVGDKPLAENAAPPNAPGGTPFQLERRSVTLTVDGPMNSVHDLLDKLQSEKILAHPHHLQLQPATGSGSTVTLDLELWLFALTRKAS